ncbi:MAG: hypothetical protein LBV33_05650 [Lachnospiraceae bacterium]|jgi:hypothetical protein|nr:hypothetical protein [Lachnospiraceae bacterium]
MARFYEEHIHNKYERLIILVGLLVILSCGLYRLSMHFGVCILDDEFAYWGMGAQMIGLDWTELLNTTSFYSYGYGFVTAPLLLTGLPAATMYQIAVILNTGMVMASFALAYWVVAQIFVAVDKRMLALAALIITLYSNNIVQMHIAWGECLLYCLFWVVVALVCRVLQRKKLLDTILLVIAVVFLYAVHNRTLGVLAAVVGIMVLFYIISLVEKKPRHHLLVGLLCLGVLFLLASWFRQYTIDNWYGNNEIVAVNDYSGNLPKVKKLNSASGIWQLFISFTAKVFAQGTTSFLLIIPPVLIMAGYTCRSLFGRIFRRNKLVWSIRDWMLLFGGGAYLLELAISAFYKSSPVITAHNFFYSRYSDFAIGPLMLFGLCLLIEHKSRLRILIFSLTIYIISGIISLTQIQRATDMTINNFHAVGIYRFFINLQTPSQAVIRMFIAGLIGFILIAGTSMIVQKTKLKWAKRAFVACICAAGIFWAGSGLQTTGEWLLLNWNQGQRIVARVQRELEKLDENTVIYYIIGGSVNHPRNAMMHLKTLQSMEPEREIHLVSVGNLPERYDGNYVYMSGTDEELIRAILTQNKQIMYDSSAQCIYVDEGTEAADLLR